MTGAQTKPTAEPLAAASLPSVSTCRPGHGLPVLLAPAGDWECAKAAVENGADAIYFGLEKFNARMRAQNFTAADLPQLMQFLHRRGVKGYLAFNILIFENEMAQAEQYLRTVIAAGVNGAVVQDVGICRLIRRLSPDFPIHASTQMTITSPAGSTSPASWDATSSSWLASVPSRKSKTWRLEPGYGQGPKAGNPLPPRATLSPPRFPSRSSCMAPYVWPIPANA